MFFGVFQLLYIIGSVVLSNEEINPSIKCKTAYSGEQNIICYHPNDSTYSLQDFTKGKGIITLHGDEEIGSDYISKFPNWNLRDKDQYALDVHYGVSQTYLFYKTLFNRNSIDDNGFAIKSYVNDPSVPNDALWNGNAMRFGNTVTGKGVTSIDIIGHELTHAITSYTSHLHPGGESGAINESISDIMGKSIEFWSNKNDSSWVISHQMSYPVRDMSNPNRFSQPSIYKDSVYWYKGSIDEKNDHINSGVGNYMFYLLAHGGSGITAKGKHYLVKGIGTFAADSIIYRTETVYLKTYSQYCDWRVACEQAANDLYGARSVQSQAVTAVWEVVGVPSCSELFK